MKISCIYYFNRHTSMHGFWQTYDSIDTQQGVGGAYVVSYGKFYNINLYNHEKL